MRQGLLESAIEVARAVNYVGAGTVEFVVNREDFYFIEMNTRLQVEHSVTELITGIDLVEWQLRIASGEQLPLKQNDITELGHAFEARLYAEDPIDFRPQAGLIKHLKFPTEQVRVDTGVRSGDVVSIHYDPMIAKLTVHGKNRDEARKRLGLAISETEIDGLISNQLLLARIVEHPLFVEARVHTGFLEEHASVFSENLGAESPELLALAAVLISNYRYRTHKNKLSKLHKINSPWTLTNGWRLNDVNRHEVFLLDEDTLRKVVLSFDEDMVQVLEPFPHLSFRPTVHWYSENYGTVSAAIDDFVGKVNFFVDSEHVGFFFREGTWSIKSVDQFIASNETSSMERKLTAPMPAKVVSVEINSGDAVVGGQVLMVLEAMKMEHAIKAPADGIIGSIYYDCSDLVEEGVELMEFVPNEEG